MNQVWPEMGLKRWAFYWWYRLCRIRATPHTIAMGMACGVGICFTPFIGLHTFFGLIAARLLGGHYLAAIIGSFASNPVMLPVFLMWQFQLSHFLIGPSQQILLQTLSWETIRENPWDLTQIWGHTVAYGMVGALPLSLVAGCLTYGVTRYMTETYKRRRQI